MTGLLLCAMLAPAAAPVPPLPANQAPPPRLVRPDISLVVVEEFGNGGDAYRCRVNLIGFRNGKPMPLEVLWEGDSLLPTGLTGGTIMASRYLIASSAAVLDLREKKLLNTRQEGEVASIDDTKVTYWVYGENREQGLFAFEYATGKLTRLDKVEPPRFSSEVHRSPDGLKAIDWKAGELFLLRPGQKPKSLGTGFKTDHVSNPRIRGFPNFPALWLDDDHLLTQRDTGKLVTVNLAGKVTDVVTIKGLPKEENPGLFRDDAGTVFYSADDKMFAIDLAKKTATPTDWCGFGNGFEIRWEADADGRRKFRHNGKGIDRADCYPGLGVSAPGHIAVRTKSPSRFVVWCAASGEWTTLDFKPLSGASAVGWIK